MVGSRSADQTSRQTDSERTPGVRQPGHAGDHVGDESAALVVRRLLEVLRYLDVISACIGGADAGGKN